MVAGLLNYYQISTNWVKHSFETSLVEKWATNFYNITDFYRKLALYMYFMQNISQSHKLSNQNVFKDGVLIFMFVVIR